MMTPWIENLLGFMRALSQILTAGIAITAFSLLLYSFAFNLRDRVARSFAFILVCMVVVFSAEAIGSTASRPLEIELWPRVQWVGIVFLPAAYFHFSDALLSITGRPSRWRRRWAVRFIYLGSAIFLLGLPFDWLTGQVILDSGPAPHLQPTLLTDVFVVFYLLVMGMAWFNFIRAYRRTTTPSSRRRMGYLVISAIAPTLGAFPFLPYSPLFAAQHQLVFWTVSVLTNIVIGALLVVMAYAVAFFGVSWPDRVVKSRLFKWLMRGPATASITLAVVTLLRRSAEAVGFSYYLTLVPIAMVITILICEYLITLLAPLGERVLFYGKDRKELEALKQLEDQLVTQNDLRQFLEMVLSAVIDRLQARGAYVIGLSPEGSELVVVLGKTRFDALAGEPTIPQDVILGSTDENNQTPYFLWGGDFLFPLYNGTEEQPELIGLIGISGVWKESIDPEQMTALRLLVERASVALHDQRVQQQVFRSIENISPQANYLQRLRAASQYDQAGLFTADDNLPENGDLAYQVKEALTHYWGGPKLTNSPLLKFQVVQVAMKEHEGNQANALRGILRRAIEQVKPGGERRFTGEWILYNILEMKFVEGRKVREIALRLAMSEADLYRKQRVAIEAVAKVIADMEVQARKGGAA